MLLRNRLVLKFAVATPLLPVDHDKMFLAVAARVDCGRMSQPPYHELAEQTVEF